MLSTVCEKLLRPVYKVIQDRLYILDFLTVELQSSYGFQSSRFRFPQEKVSGFRISQAKFSRILETTLPSMITGATEIT